ncbi:MAG: thioredoxin family protein [Acidobacteria bacterium]|nr:thioredoxin family protein [Acidobacteriota bacterium]
MFFRFWKLLCLSLVSTCALGQQFQDVVRYQLRADVDQVRAGEQLTARLIAHISKGWHLYSMTQPSGGPIPTTIQIEKNPVFVMAGPVLQPPVHTWFDQNFGIETQYFEGSVEFEIPVLVVADATMGTYMLPVSVTYMVCSDTLCLPPQTRQMKVGIEVKDALSLKNESVNTLATASPGSKARENAEKIDTPVQGGSKQVLPATPSKPLPAEAGGRALPTSTWAYLGFAAVMGALALTTPCVFPMIPITVSYFTQRRGTRKRAVGDAALYSVGIVLTFTLIGFLLTLIFGAGGINRLAANPAVNLVIAAIFILFALNLFGMLRIQVPSQWLSFLGRQSGTGGATGILLMALTFSLTSFTCTVPFVGTVMVAALQGDVIWSLAGVTMFALVFSAPFFALAIFPSFLHSLPRSGNWMNSMKITMGFLELAASVKFLSNVDLVYQWEWLTRPVFVTIWLAISLVTFLYLLGKFHFPHETPPVSIGGGRVLFSIFFLALTVYLLRGLLGLPLGELDAFLPPKDYGNPTSVAWLGSGADPQSEQKWLKNYQEALIVSRAQRRPVFVDFTGYTCTNCRWMEANIFILPEVKQLFSKYVLVRLYTDGTKPEHKENLRFEQTRFGTIALPLYAVMSPEDEILSTFPGLTRNKEEFVSFLENGLARYAASNGIYQAPLLNGQAEGDSE